MKKSNDCVNYKRTILFLFCYILCFNLNAQKVHHDGTLIKGKKCLITDNSINVRSNSSIEAEKLFKVNAGDIEVIQSTGLNIKDPIILFKRSISYGAGKIENCTVCRFHNEERIDEIYFAETVWENSELENQDIFFPQITYDVYHRKWKTSILNTQIKENEIKIVKTKGKTAPYEDIDETDIIEIKKQESIILDLTKVL